MSLRTLCFLAPGLAVPLALAAAPAQPQQLRQIETLRGTNAFCTVEFPDGDYHYVYEGRFDRSDGILRKMSSTLRLTHLAYETARVERLVPTASRPYMERTYPNGPSTVRTIIRIASIKMDAKATNSRMVLSAGGKQVTRNVMLPFPIFKASNVAFEFGPETREMFEVPFDLTFYDLNGLAYFRASFKPQPEFEQGRGTNLLRLTDEAFEGKPAGAAHLPKTCRIERHY